MSTPASAADAASSPAAEAEAPSAADQSPNDLAALRAELDRIDDAMHDLLMRRAEVVTRVAASPSKANGRVALRPGREASIIRRLLERHQGPLPPQALVRIWRELLAATTSMQGPFVVAVCDPEPGALFTQAAREQFGALTPVRVHGSAAQAIAEVSAGRASVAVLPRPSEADPPREAWWTTLMQRDSPRIHIVARLPFWSRRGEGAPTAQALVVAAVPPDPSGQDRSLLGLELEHDISRARVAAALTAAGLAPDTMILQRDPATPDAHALVEVDGFVTEDDARLAQLGAALRHVVVLGAYPVPIEAETR